MTDDNIHTSPTARKSRDSFTETQFNWLRQVAYDDGLFPSAARVAIALTKYFSRQKGGWAWMGQAALANDIGMSVRTVGYALASLTERGHLICKRMGREKPNHYRPALKTSESDRQSVADHDRQSVADHPPRVIGNVLQSDRQKVVKVIGKGLQTNPLKEPLEEPIEIESDSQLDLGDEDSGRRREQTPTVPDSIIDADFEKFWVQVPRKVAKPKAAQLFKRIVKNREATVDELMAGILRYSAEVANREERYIAYPSTWLSQGRWADEPAKPIGTTIDADGNPIRPPPPDRSQRGAPPQNWMEIAFAGMNRGQSHEQ